MSTSAEYVVIDNSFEAKEILKEAGFHWDKNRKKWILPDSINSAVRVQDARKAIKEAGYDCNIQFFNGDWCPGCRD